ncbi:MAG TPA: hypothetical protein VH092_20235, partial [Urbifossiella sp.]|nr:hypothetical protein [Urbifossiella sp.]
ANGLHRSNQSSVEHHATSQMTGPINPLYAMSSIASKNGNEKLMSFATYLFVGLGAVMLVKELKGIMGNDKQTRCFDRDEVSRRSR